ncbi:MAG: fatty acid desaturase [Bdellovibrionales bacterium]|nr:fatty acid desaturase [Bdellovibrionales bacterium]
MRIYNVLGYSILLVYGVLCALVAPAHFGPWLGFGIGAAYLIAGWFMAGLYLSDVIHMGIAHRALDYKPWFIHLVTFLNNTFGIYVNPETWVNRHRLHHRYADTDGDPNKLASDGFWKTLKLCLFPYACNENVANDSIFKTPLFRFISNPVYAVVSQVFNFALLYWLVKDLGYAVTLWLGTRIFAIWVNMVQNYWTHDKRWGYRRYEDADNAMNIGDWLPVMATFSACLQNNHHHFPSLLRLSHDDSEFDFGFMTVKVMRRLGLVTATRKGTELGPEIPLKSFNF